MTDRQMEICDACHGAGGDNQHTVCGKCDGAGGYPSPPEQVETKACPRYQTRGGGSIAFPCANCDCRFRVETTPDAAELVALSADLRRIARHRLANPELAIEWKAADALEHLTAKLSASEAEVARKDRALRAADESLRDYACHGGPTVRCLRTPEQCRDACGKEAGDALLIVTAVLARQEPEGASS